ncbi:MAG: acetoin utilization protein AcuC [Proteobacteria bacterium]|nr:acetoin utilization protein AcuC [Pseudomonadota bacterium]
MIKLPVRARRLRGLGPRYALYVDNPLFKRSAYRAQHPLSIARTGTVAELSRILGWLHEDAIETCTAASVDTLCRFHDRAYVSALKAADESGRVEKVVRARYAFGTMENPLFPGVFARAATAVGGSIRAAELALEGRIVFHPAGGTHHGKPDRASGFCYFNDPVFALLGLLDAGLERILYVDLDAHHGDGVQDAFQTDPRVHLVSIHETDRWPFTGSTNPNSRIANLVVAKHLGDREFATLIRDSVLPLCASVAPQAIVITCGADALAGDPLSTMRLSNVALWRAVRQIANYAAPVVVLGGGGYNPWTLARCWAGLWATLAGFEIPSSLPEAATRLLASLECDLIDDEDVQAAWISSISDDPEFNTLGSSMSEVTAWTGGHSHSVVSQ